MDVVRLEVRRKPSGDPARSWLPDDVVSNALRAAHDKDVVAALRVVAAKHPSLVPDAHERALDAWSGKRSDPSADKAEEFVATNLFLFVLWAIRQLRTMAGFSITNGLLFALALASYPFSPSRELATMGAVTVLTTLVVALATFVMLERDSLLSKISGTTAGRIEWNVSFVAQLATWVLLPFLAFLATQYPDETRTLLGWASPYLPSK